MFSVIYISVLLVISSAPEMECSNYTAEEALINSLLASYNTQARPVTDPTRPVNVQLAMNIVSLVGIDTRQQHVEVSGWITATWVDEKLTWTPSSHEGIQDVALSPNQVWLPEFVLANSASGQQYNSNWYSLYKVLVTSDGTVIWRPGGNFAANCAINVKFFPFDEQICSFVFQNWIYSGDRVNLTFTLDAADGFLDFYTENNIEWDVLSANVVQRNTQFSELATRSFPEIHFGMKVKRKPLFYIINVILVSVLLAFLVLLNFRLPAESGERVSMGMTLLLAFSVFILMVDASIPNSSIDVPLIIVYLLLVMAMTTLGISESVLILHCYHHTGSHRPPMWARYIVFKFMAKCLCKKTQITKLHLEEHPNMNGVEKQGTGDQTKKEPVQHITLPDDNIQEWREMSYLIDQFFFWLFLIVFGLIMLICLIIIPNSQTGLDINNTKIWAGF